MNEKIELLLLRLELLLSNGIFNKNMEVIMAVKNNAISFIERNKAINHPAEQDTVTRCEALLARADNALALLNT